MAQIIIVIAISVALKAGVRELQTRMLAGQNGADCIFIHSKTPENGMEHGLVFIRRLGSQVYASAQSGSVAGRRRPFYHLHALQYFWIDIVNNRSAATGSK